MSKNYYYFLNYTHVYSYVLAHACEGRCPHRSEEAVEAPGAGVTGSCDCLVQVLGAELGSL